MNPFVKDFNGSVNSYEGKDYIVKRVMIKLYNIEFIFNLNAAGLKLLEYIFIHQKSNKDTIELTPYLLVMPKTTFVRAKNDLIKNKVIVQKIGDVYYTNFNYFFKGDLIKCYPNLKKIITE